MRHVLHLVEGARIEQRETKQPPHPLIQPARAEHRPVAELVLSCVEAIEQDSLTDEGELCLPGIRAAFERLATAVGRISTASPHGSSHSQCRGLPRASGASD